MSPSTAGNTATAHTHAISPGTTMVALRICAVENGNVRARPPVRLRTRRLPRNGIRAATRANAARNGMKKPRPRASAVYGTSAEAASPRKGFGKRTSRWASRQISAVAPRPLPDVGFTCPRATASRSTRMSRARPRSSANIAPCMPLTSEPPLSRRARRIRLSRRNVRTTNARVTTTPAAATAQGACSAHPGSASAATPAETSTSQTTTAVASAATIHCTTWTDQVRSAVCSNAA